jgi:leucyl-tRNA synthetase
MTVTYSPLTTEPKILEKWATLPLPSRDNAPKKYILEMFPYPSGHLHMGHVRNYTIGDVQARYYRMAGFDVIHPIGFDSFGLPAENAAITHGINPLEWTEKNIAHMRNQLQRLGLGYDWWREVSTSRPSYYHWNQWLFKKFYEKGLVYRKSGYVNWDPVDQTVLANEQVIDGKGWRSGAPVEQKYIDQWYIRITDYAEELLRDLDTLTEWPDRVKNMQRQWIGKSEGTTVYFTPLFDPDAETTAVFTTRPDTLMGVSYVAVAPEHPFVMTYLTKSPNREACMAYIQSVLAEPLSERGDASTPKTGIDTGLRLAHPITGESVPLWIANYVLMDYGTGAVMGVPAHDDRDYAFATAYDLPIIPVIQDPDTPHTAASAYTGPGILVQSGAFNGLTTDAAKTAISQTLVSSGKGTIKPYYRLRDWLISRQRYWGTPIPILYDEQGTPQAVDDGDLPVTLPTDCVFDGVGNPLEKSEDFGYVVRDGRRYRRETDTMDTFFDSSWYFYRYSDPTNADAPFDPTIVDACLPVDVYIGGIEHACLHLLYARFFTKVLRDLGLCRVSEPFKRLVCQGMVLYEGAKMSKSLGNTVDPAHIIDEYGADTARLFILFGAPVERDLDWSDTGVEGSFRFLKRFFTATVHWDQKPVEAADAADLQRALHKTIQKMTHDIERFQFNTAISALMELVNAIQKIGSSLAVAQTMARLIAPFAPFIAETCWTHLGGEGSVHDQSWPTYSDEWLTADSYPLVIQINGKRRGDIQVPTDLPEAEAVDLARNAVAIQPHLINKTIRKTIFVKDRLVNFVVN